MVVVREFVFLFFGVCLHVCVTEPPLGAVSRTIDVLLFLIPPVEPPLVDPFASLLPSRALMRVVVAAAGVAVAAAGVVVAGVVVAGVVVVVAKGVTLAASDVGAIEDQLESGARLHVGTVIAVAVATHY